MKQVLSITASLCLLVCCRPLSSPDIHQSIKEGNLEQLRTAIQRGADINGLDQQGMTPLYLSVVEGHEEIMRFLVESGADVNGRTSEGFTPLIRAAESRAIQTMEYLISKGAQVGIAGNDGYIALHAVLIKADKTKQEVLDMVELLLVHRADVNANSGPGKPLHYAVGGYGYPEIVQLLLSKGADVDAVGPDGTALSLAAARDSLELVLLLLEHGADPNLEDYKGKRPLHNAARRGNEQIGKALLDHGADINARMIGSETPLHEAMKYRHLSMMKFLLDNGADVNAETAQGTLLDEAEREQRKEMCSLLLKYGARRSNNPRK